MGQNFPLADPVHDGPFTQHLMACDAFSHLTSPFPTAAWEGRAVRGVWAVREEEGGKKVWEVKHVLDLE